MRKYLAIAGILALGLFSASAKADDQYAFGYSGFNSSNNLTINGTAYTNTDSGYIMSDGTQQQGNRNYVSVMYSSGTLQINNYFSFDLSSLTGTVTSASFDVYTYTISATGTYDIYATSLTPTEVNSSNYFSSVADFDALTSGTEIGTITLDPSEDNTTATITLNSDGLAWLQANEGNEVVVGGEFGGSTVTPEPGSLLLFGTGILGLAVVLRRKIVPVF
jgi:hypothetical protein